MNTSIECSGLSTDPLLEVVDMPVSFRRCLVPVAASCSHRRNGRSRRRACRAGSRRRQGGHCAGPGNWKNDAWAAGQGLIQGVCRRPEAHPSG